MTNTQQVKVKNLLFGVQSEHQESAKDIAVPRLFSNKPFSSQQSIGSVHRNMSEPVRARSVTHSPL